MGVSASHLDWTMVPYVRKSFFKHYNDVRDTLDLEPIEVEDIEGTEIDSVVYVGNDDETKRIWKKALKRTEKEVHQAVEGMYHNLTIFG